MVMKKISVAVLTAFIAAGFAVIPAQAKEGKIETGIYVEEVDISGMTESEVQGDRGICR